MQASISSLPSTNSPRVSAGASVRGALRQARPAMVLVVVLLIIGVLGLLAASFSYRMNADMSAVKASQDQQQALLAARVGYDVAIEMLRENRTDMSNWYNNYQKFRRIPVFLPGDRMGDEGKGGSMSVADQDKIEGKNIWRFSLVGNERTDPKSDRVKIRYGITDEASKINLNTASRSQLLALFDSVKHEGVSSEELADALLIWIGKGNTALTNTADDSYYLTLHPAYRAKKKPLTSVEELLMVKGFNGRILYGEDYNRNGYLDSNEDDGEENGAFPPDDGDGQLNQGLLPYITVYSWDWNRSNDNKMRVDINTIKFSQVASGAGDTGAGAGNQQAGANGLSGLAAMAQKVPAHITEELRPEVIDFIAEAQKRNYKFKSVGDLLGLEVYEDGSSNHDDMWKQYAKKFRKAEARVEESDQSQEDNADEENDANDQNNDGKDNQGNQNNNGQNNNNSNNNNRTGSNRNNGANDNNTNNGSNSNNTNADESSKKDKSNQTQQQSVRADQPNTNNDSNSSNNGPNNNRRGGRNNNNSAGSERDNNRGGNRNDNPDGNNGSNSGRDSNDRNGDNNDGSNGNDRGNRPRGGRGNRNGQNNGNQQGAGGNQGGGTQGGGNQGTGGNQGAGGNQGTGGKGRGTPVVSPVEAADMAVLLDRLTVWNSPVVAGLVNVNTAQATVLRTIPGLEEPDVESIIDKRQGVQVAEKLTPAWLVGANALTPEKFALISSLVTTRSIQFTIDSIGFADHVGTVKRIQAVVEMRGELAQLKYYRDITSLGVGYPVWDDQRSDGFAFTDR